MSLDEYRRKRSRGRTPEPFGASGDRADRPLRFVVQRHAARRLHYDFRLERDGALASWAVPKGVPLRSGERHLAVHVEDHPLDYADFEGMIPAGEYGAGTVEIWDRGTYELLEEKRTAGSRCELHGERLEGVWTLVPATLDGDPKNWLLLRKDAGDGRRARGTGRCSRRPRTRCPTGEGWVYEPKWDGFRAIVTVSGGDVTFTSRNGNDLTERFGDVARAAALAIRSSDAVLDGEICALDDQGRSRFSLLQEGGGNAVLVLFDLLELESENARWTSRSGSGGSGSRDSSTRTEACSCRRSSTTGRPFSPRRASRSSRASSPSARTRRTGPVGAPSTGTS